MIRAGLAVAALALVCASGASAAADPAKYMPARLIAESGRPAPGTTIWIGIEMSPKPGWHGYWSNPGDSGIAPSVRWTAPNGVKFGPLTHPAPVLLSANGIDSFVHAGQHVLLARMSIPHAMASGTAIPVVADLRWAACTARQCVPLHAKLTLRLAAGTGARSADWPLIHDGVRKLPRPAPDGVWFRSGHRLRLQLPVSLKLDPGSTRFFANTPGVFDTGAARTKRVGSRIVIDAPSNGAVPRSFGGVVSDGRASYRLTFIEAKPMRRR